MDGPHTSRERVKIAPKTDTVGWAIGWEGARRGGRRKAAHRLRSHGRPAVPGVHVEKCETHREVGLIRYKRYRAVYAYDAAARAASIAFWNSANG